MNQDLALSRSRVSARAIISGVLVTFALLLTLLSLCAGIGIWNYNIMEFGTDNARGLWMGAFASWIVSVYVGSYVSSMTACSNDKIGGMLHGLDTWGAST